MRWAERMPHAIVRRLEVNRVRLVTLLRGLAGLRPRHVRALPLAAVFVASEVLWRLSRPAAAGAGAPPALQWGRGVTVLIPERGDPAMLRACLDALSSALARLDEPAQVVVVVNGSPLADYETTFAAHPGLTVIHRVAPLGFTSAVRLGLTQARHPAVYLLNNDMILEPDALVEAMRWRDPRVFAVASQILFPDTTRRREETGWTTMDVERGVPRPAHREPDDDTVRGTVWAGAGSSLFHAQRLRETVEDSVDYDPFYWEDVDWGVRGWRDGYHVVCVPRSRAVHRHRVTVERFYPSLEIDRVFERNRLLFQLRNPQPPQPVADTLRWLLRMDAVSSREIGSLPACLRLWQARRRAMRAPHRGMPYDAMSAVRYRRLPRPVAIVVSPFVVLPPAHGGAVRTHRLADALSVHYDVVLLSDEAALYRSSALDADSRLHALHLVHGRPPEPAGLEGDRTARIRSHSHQGLKDALARAIAGYRPELVVVEHAELAGLVEGRHDVRPRFALDLHDVLLAPDDPAQRAADRFEGALLDRFDDLLVCSEEDQALLGARRSLLVPNGFDPTLLDGYRPSAGRRSLLFVGPFRALNNWQGIVAFLEQAYPALRARVPDVRLTIVGGRGALAAARGQRCFADPSIEVLEQVPDLRPLLDHCAMTINPQPMLRGSSLKVIESLAVGRICVSTLEGARGHRALGLPSLVCVPTVADFVEPLAHWLGDEPARLALERPDLGRLARRTWPEIGADLVRHFAGTPRDR